LNDDVPLNYAVLTRTLADVAEKLDVPAKEAVRANTIAAVALKDDVPAKDADGFVIAP
jgi:hypothetical protein